MNPLERDIMQLAALYDAQRRAVVYKVSNPGGKGKDGGRGWANRPATFVDFGGWTWNFARAICLEAKYCGLKADGETPTCKVSFPLSRLEDIQWRMLGRAEQCGAIGALYLRRHVDVMRTQDYLIPTHPVHGFAGRRAGAKSIKWADVQQYKIPLSKTWLDAAINASGALWRWEEYKEEGWGYVLRLTSSQMESRL